MKATIDQTEKRHTQSGDPFLVLTLEGHKFSLFDQDLDWNLREGDQIEFTWTDNGRFRKIKTMEKVGG